MWLKHLCKWWEDVEKDLKEDGVWSGRGGEGAKNKPHLKASHN